MADRKLIVMNNGLLQQLQTGDVPVAPTASLGTNTTQIATMAALQAAVQAAMNYSSPSGYRPSTQSGKPVPDADRVSQGTVYLVKKTGLTLLVPNSTQTDFDKHEPADSSITWTVSGSSGDVKDLYVWNNAGTLTAVLSPAWSGANSRGTGAGTAEQDTLKGIVVNKVTIGSMPAKAGIYLGTIQLSGTNVTEQSVLNQFVFSPYNQVIVYMSFSDGGGYTYGPGGAGNHTQQWNNNSAAKISFVVGNENSMVWGNVGALCYTSAATAGAFVSASLDSASLVGVIGNYNTGSYVFSSGDHTNRLTIGKHYVAITWTIQGANTGNYSSCLLKGYLLC